MLPFLGDRLFQPELAEPIGRAAFLLIDESRRWTTAFLADLPAPAEFADAMRRAMPLPAPATVPATMVAQALEVPSFRPAFRRSAPRIEQSPS